MFTSRAEFRLSLRADNADERLTPMAVGLGMVGRERSERFNERVRRLDEARNLARSVSLTPNEARKHGLNVNLDGTRRSAYELMAQSGTDISRLQVIWPEFGKFDVRTRERLETEARYSVYLDRQNIDISLLRREERRLIPSDLDYSGFSGLSNELRQKLSFSKPRSIAEANRIDGMTPAALALILAHLRTREGAQSRKAH